MIPIVAVIGRSKSGKTTIIEHIVSYLSSEGLKVGTIKHVHHPGFSIDVKGKDTWRHAQAGAKTVVCVASDEVAMIKKKGASYQTLEELLTLFKDEELDVIVIEGFHDLIAKRTDIFKILTVKSEEGLKESLTVLTEPIVAIVGPTDSRKLLSGKIFPFVEFENAPAEIPELIKDIILRG